MPKLTVNHYGKFIEIETADKSITIYCTDEQLRDLFEQLETIYREVKLPSKRVIGIVEMTIEDNQVVLVELK